MAVSLLEVNAYPDFKQTGSGLGGVIQGLLDETARIAVAPFFGCKVEEPSEMTGGSGMVKVLDVELGSW